MRHLYDMLHLYDQKETPMRGAVWRGESQLQGAKVQLGKGQCKLVAEL